MAALVERLLHLADAAAAKRLGRDRLVRSLLVLPELRILRLRGLISRRVLRHGSGACQAT
jgi:hypothetical protein